MTITSDILYVGVNDTTIDLFEGQYKVPNGISYNSYIVFDDKITVFDTADKRKTAEWLQNVKRALGGKKPDYLVISHMEPDHSASLAEFLREYPDTAVVGNAKTFAFVERFFGDVAKNKLVVKDGDELVTGKHRFTFVFAPMVHWPEVMLTYDASAKVLFSADAFGKFGIPETKEDWTPEARRYYLNIVGKFGAPVQTVLKKAAALDIEIICPLHGPVLKENLGFYLNKYDIWSSYRAEDNGVAVAYASVYGHTADAAKLLAEKLTAKGVNVALFDLARDDNAEALSQAFRYDKLVVASTTYDGGIFPAVEAFVNRLKHKNYQSRKVAFIENGSWAPMSAKLMRAEFETMKNISFAEHTVTVKSALDAEARDQIDALCAELLAE